MADKDRPSKRDRGYDSAWDKFAKDFVLSHPVCAICGAPSEVCDHKTETAQMMMDAYGSFDLNPDKYQALCQRCNKAKAKQDKQSWEEYQKQKEALDGFIVP